nr:4Fe-4S dicluster domain-containing protein [Sedimentibacter sp.]
MEKNMLDLVKNAGIVGAGGAGFPTHVKINSKAQYIIINGAECEPLLRVDQQLMASRSNELLEGLNLIMEHTGAEKGFIALKEKYKPAIENINSIIGKYKDISLYTLGNFYPAGDEQVLVYEVTKRIVPEGGIPLNVGVIVINVETVLNIYDAYYKEKPVTNKYVTVTGEVKNQVTLNVPIGITVREAINLAGGSATDDYVVINGGPMMGKVVDADSLITKTTKGLIVLPKNHSLVVDLDKDISQSLKESRTACMHCSLCTEVCPRNLLGHRLEPNKLIRLESYTSVRNETLIPMSAFLCCECRLCEYACVMNLQPWKVNSFLKGSMAKSGIRSNLNNVPKSAHPFRDYKKYPVHRLIYKLGLDKYDKSAPLDDMSKEFNKVTIPLKQHIGVSSIAVVNVGDVVEKGDLIGDIPDSKMGSKVHASITGTITEINDNTIIIERGI